MSGLASADRGRDLRRLWRVGVGVKLGRNRVRRGRIRGRATGAPRRRRTGDESWRQRRGGEPTLSICPDAIEEDDTLDLFRNQKRTKRYHLGMAVGNFPESSTLTAMEAGLVRLWDLHYENQPRSQILIRLENRLVEILRYKRRSCLWNLNQTHP
jgi:hypothetical protein